jgi:hypothetical protein
MEVRFSVVHIRIILILKVQCSSGWHPKELITHAQKLHLMGIIHIVHKRFSFEHIQKNLLEFSLKSSCLHPLFGPLFTPYPLFD